MFEDKAFKHGGRAVAEIIKELRELEFLLRGLEGELDK